MSESTTRHCEVWRTPSLRHGQSRSEKEENLESVIVTNEATMSRDMDHYVVFLFIGKDRRSGEKKHNKEYKLPGTLIDSIKAYRSYIIVTEKLVFR